MFTEGADRVGVRLPGTTGVGTCRIAARRLMLTGDAYRVGVRLPDRGQQLRRDAGASW
jgi:hypothetical protein